VLLFTLKSKIIGIFLRPHIYIILVGLIVLVLLLMLSFVWGVFHGVYNGLFEFTGIPEDELLNDFVQQSARGNHAIAKCVLKGDSSITSIWQRTDGFIKLRGPQTARVTSMLLHTDTTLSLAACWKMWLNAVVCTDSELNSEEYKPHEIVAPKIAGAYLLIRKGMFKKNDVKDLIYIFEIYNDDFGYVYCNGMDHIYQARSLLVLSLAHIKELSVSDQFTKLLKKIDGRYGFPEILIEACGIMGDPSLIASLREQLVLWKPAPYINNNKQDSILDQGPRILRSLLLLGDYEATDLFISRCLSSEYTTSEHLKCLNRLTGIEKKMTATDWSNWFKREGKSLKLTDIAINMLRQEVTTFGERSLFFRSSLTGVINEVPDYPFECFEKVRHLLQVKGDERISEYFIYLSEPVITGQAVE